VAPGQCWSHLKLNLRRLLSSERAPVLQDNVLSAELQPRAFVTDETRTLDKRLFAVTDSHFAHWFVLSLRAPNPTDQSFIRWRCVVVVVSIILLLLCWPTQPSIPPESVNE